MSLYPITAGLLPQASDVQQLNDIFTGKHDIGIINFAPQLLAPSTSGFSLALATGSNLGVGNYSYVFTYITGYYKTDGVTFNKTGETVVSSSLSVTTTSGNQAVKITFPTTGFPSTAYQIGIYRTAVGGSTYQMVGTIKIGNSSYTDNIADSSLGSSPPSANTTGTSMRMSAQPSVLVFPVSFGSLAANTETTIPYNGSWFNNGIFTAPLTGNYFFSANVYLNINNGNVLMWIYKNNTALYVLDKYVNPTTNTNEYVLKGAILMSLSAGDTIKFTATSSAGSTVNTAHCPCSVFKVF